jgi:hypothetical protein
LSQRDLRGPWLNSATRIEDAHITGIHLALPGYDKGWPTLEIFQYDVSANPLASEPNRKGYGHIAFKADNIAEVMTRLLQNGGTAVGEMVTTEISHSGEITFVYARDIRW